MMADDPDYIEPEADSGGDVADGDAPSVDAGANLTQDQSQPLTEPEDGKPVAPEATPDDSLAGSPQSTAIDADDFDHESVFDPTGIEEPFGEEAEPILSVGTDALEPDEKPDRPEAVDSQQPDFHRMHKFTLYETNVRYWITGADITDKYFKLLKIDRTAPPGQLSIFEDDIIYNKKEITELLTAIDDGNKATGGLRLKCNFWGVLGFIRFTESYYMLLVTKRQQVAMLGGHYVYQVDGTELIPLTTGASSRFARDRNPEEGRFLGILNNLDLTKSFYFSYSYNITRTLQDNIISQRVAINNGISRPDHDFNDMFVWNNHLLKPAMFLKKPYDWCLPIIHGFIDQATLDVFGRSIYITIIGRRSRFFAGARFLKRGANDDGYVANDVETEQIVSEMLTTSFHAPGPRMFSNPTYTSYVHHRGSIPLYWTQDNSGVSPKPDIDVNLTDPFYQPAALHFDDLFKRYGTPIYVLNLIKARERTPRESKLLVEFHNSIEYLNQFLPDDKKIIYRAFDMSRAAKTRGINVITSLEEIAEDVVQKTNFFRNGVDEDGTAHVQNGVARTNCIDCLDRTNAAQFVIGKRALGHQLQALGVLPNPNMGYDSDAVNIFTHMFHDHGDTIAVQYGGSHLVNTMATYRKINHWQSSSRDMVESFKRYYHNSFLDSQRQEAYNLFLGNYIWSQGQPMLWDLATDYYLHHSDPKTWLNRNRRNYIDWFTPEHLEPRAIPSLSEHSQEGAPGNELSRFDDYWLEYYRPLAVSSFLKVYAYRMNANSRYLPDQSNKDGKFDFSPFVPRRDPNKQEESPGKKPIRKEVTIVDPRSENETRRRVDGSDPRGGEYHDSNGQRESTAEMQRNMKLADKAAMAQMTLNKIYEKSLDPSVTVDETMEYEHYISHPLNLPLVVSDELPTEINEEFSYYVQGLKDEFDGEDMTMEDVSEDELAEYVDYLTVRDDPLTVFEEDGTKKRYKAYRQWLKGKSLFKQSKVDPEYKAS